MASVYARSFDVALLALSVCTAGCSVAIDDALAHRSRDAGHDAVMDGGVDDDADICSGSSCECTATDTNACRPDERCDLVAHVCACKPAHVRTDQDACMWSSPIVAGDFGTLDPWLLAGGASIATGAGMARLGCSARASQTFELPSSESAEPVVFEVTGRAVSHPHTGRIDVRLNGRVVASQTLPYDTQGTLRVCLGSAEFGRAVTLTLSASIDGCTGNDHLELDRVSLVPANVGECPATGALLNGDFEAQAGWSPRIAAFGGTGSAFYAASIGEGGTRGGRIESTGTAFGSFDQPMSFPEAAGHAIELWWSPLDGTELHAFTGTPDFSLLNASSIGTFVAGPASSARRRLCVPRALGGIVARAGFGVSGRLRCTSSTCAGTLDSIAIVPDATCATSSLVPDGGFEISGSATYLSPWTVWGDGGTGTISAASIGRSGAGARLTVDSDCDVVRLETLGLAPVSRGLGGPAISVWARRASSSGSHVRAWVTSPDWFAVDLGSLGSTAWTETRRCLPPGTAGRAVLVSLRVRGSIDEGCTLDTGFLGETVYFDDVALVEDPSCPSE